MILALTIATLLLAAPAQEVSETPVSAKTTEELESARARWERLTPQEQEHARERYRRFLALGEEAREQLKESARRLRERSERVQGELEGKAREGFSAMDPEKRRALVREIAAEEARDVGARIRGRLPEKWLERLEKARPQDRARFLRQFQVQQRKRWARYAIGEIGKHLKLPDDEIARLQRLPGEERGRAVLELRQKLTRREADQFGLWPGITRAQWDEWQRLPPEEFFEAFQRYRQSRMWHAGLLREPVLSRENEAPGSAARPADGEAETRPEDHLEAQRALLEAVRPRPEAALALADLPPVERAARLASAKRERCMQAIRDGRLLSPAEIRALEAKSYHEFFEIVRRLLKPSGQPIPARRDEGGAQPR